MDETYVGGKPRYKGNNKRGRGSKGKTSVVGAVQRNGEVKAQVTNDTKGRTLLGFIKERVEVARSALVTDHYGAYYRAGELMPHVIIDHRRGYVDPRDKAIHTNTHRRILGADQEGFQDAGCPCLSVRPVGNITTGTTQIASTRS